MDIFKICKDLSPQIINWRRDLHKIPELGLNLPETRKYVVNELEKMGIEYKTYSEHSGIICVLGKKEGKVIAIRADMDGLPIKEETGLEYASQNENMHACGHDSHTAILLGVAKILKEHENEINGQIKLIFQPSEERAPSGAFTMIKDGVLENPKVDAILAHHNIRSLGKFKNGDIVVKYGPVLPASDKMNIKIIGKGGHGSMPEKCVDPIAIAALVINNIQYILSREIKQGVFKVISFGSIHGGNAGNVIPSVVELTGTIRNSDEETREHIKKRIREIVEGVTKSMGANHELNFGSEGSGGIPALVNDFDIVESVVKSAKNILPENEIHVFDQILMGSEDASYYFEKIPGCFFALCTEEAYDDGTIYPQHNSKFLLNDSVLYKATAVFIQSALDFLNY